MTKPAVPSPPASGEREHVNVDYIKGQDFRAIRPDGAIGSITPRGEVQLALFTERQAIPQRMVHELDSNGRLGDVIEKVGRDAIVRELDVVIAVDIDTAEDIVIFLQDAIKRIKNRTRKARKK